METERQIAMACINDDACCLDSLLSSAHSFQDLKIQTADLKSYESGTYKQAWQRVNNKISFRTITPMHLAAFHGSWRCVEFFLKHRLWLNDSVESSDGNKYPPLCFVLLALEFTTIDLSTEAPFYLHDSSKRQDLEKCLRVLLTGGARAEVPVLIRWPLLHRAMDANMDTEIIQLLARQGADVNGIDNRKMTALHFAVVYDKSRYIEPLIKLGAEVDKRGPGGMTAICYAANFGKDPSYDRVKILYESGANPNITNSYGRTALHSACAGGVVDHINYLADKIDDVNALTNDGDTALDLAVKNICNFHLYNNVIDANSPFNTDYSTTVAKCFINMMNHGAKFNRMTLETTQTSVLYLAEVLCALLNSAAYVDLRESDVGLPFGAPYQYQNFYQSLGALRNGPRSLRHLSRCTVRNSLGKKIHSSLDGLRLPARLKSYIRLEPSLHLELD
ncbi:ankyrin repeat and SOCS box protein 8-like isoform X1 [Ptychodera flava]|uniref:ankyrin repeat and SOCS box protein 8-like isoform X1 n=1 Tax=Ptychodera flava TaxID=63121 RepID=UPI00396A63DA